MWVAALLRADPSASVPKPRLGGLRIGIASAPVWARAGPADMSHGIGDNCPWSAGQVISYGCGTAEAETDVPRKGLVVMGNDLVPPIAYEAYNPATHEAPPGGKGDCDGVGDDDEEESS